MYGLVLRLALDVVLRIHVAGHESWLYIVLLGKEIGHLCLETSQDIITLADLSQFLLERAAVLLKYLIHRFNYNC